MLYVSEWFLILATYASGIVLLLVLFQLARRERERATNFTALLLTFWLAYLLLGAIVALATPRRILSIGQPRFYDETGIAVTAVQLTPCIQTSSGPRSARGVFLIVSARLFNRSTQVPHHSPALEALLQDAVGNIYRPDPTVTGLLNSGHDPLARYLLAPHGSRTVQLAFDIPLTTRNPGVMFQHADRHALNRILLGDPEHFWHRPTVVLLDR